MPTPEPRKPSTRFKGERQPKRRLSSTPPPPTPKAKRPSIQKEIQQSEEVAREEVAIEPNEEKDPLPFNIKDNATLPIVKEPQSPDLPLSRYQSIAESGVIHKALARSRHKWLSEPVFEKFWTKPSKKKGIDDSNPARDSMQKLPGECFMIIEPHSFKVTLFSVKAPQVTFLPPVGQSMPFPGTKPNPPGYGPPPPHPYAPPAYQGHPPPADQQNVHHHSIPVQHSMPAPIPPFRPTEKNSGSGPSKSGSGPTDQSSAPQPIRSHAQSPTQPQPQSKSQSHGEPESPRQSRPQSQGSTQNQGQTQPQAQVQSKGQGQHQSQPPPTPKAPQAQRPPPNTSQKSRQESNTNTDPVIQMLAARAASDHELKALMKVVAQGQASQEQLGIFQKHIDELNGIIQAQRRQAAASGAPPGPSQSSPPPPSQNAGSQRPPPSAATRPQSPQQPNHLPPPPRPQYLPPPPTYYQPPAQYIKPKAAVQSKHNISAVVFEFAEATGVRYLIPRNSIIEYLPGNTQVLVSFIVIRKGDAAPNRKYDSSKEYYQPITIRLVAENPKALEPLSRVVAPVEEVRKHLTENMDKSNRAEDAYLATRLPRAEEDPSKDSEPASPPTDPDVPQEYYEAPSSLLPLRHARIAAV